MPKPIRLMIVDDHPLYREGVKALLSTTTDILVVGEAGDSASALRQIPALSPDIVLMDIWMPGTGGIQATRAILELDERIGVIMVTMQEDDASVFAAMRAGARGYVLKGANPQEMLAVIRAVAGGQALFGPAIAMRMRYFFKEVDATLLTESEQDGTLTPRPQKKPAGELSSLTGREREVLELIAEGYNNTEIAQKLVISPKTVRNHITRIFSKLQVADRFQAIRRARQALDNHPD